MNIEVTIRGLTERQIDALMIGVANVNRTLTDELNNPLPDQLATPEDLISWAIEFSLLPPLLDQLDLKELNELKAMWDAAPEGKRVAARGTLTEIVVEDRNDLVEGF